MQAFYQDSDNESYNEVLEQIRNNLFKFEKNVIKKLVHFHIKYNLTLIIIIL